MNGLGIKFTHLACTMKRGLAAPRHSLHLSAVQVLSADLEVGLRTPLADSVDRGMLTMQQAAISTCRSSCWSALRICKMFVNTRVMRTNLRPFLQTTCSRIRVSATP